MTLQEEEFEEPCFMPDCPNKSYRWIQVELGQEMVACEKHFHELWAGEN